MTTAADWALEATFPDPFGSFVTLFSTVTDLSVPHLVPLGCVAPYDYHTHLLIVTLGPLALMLACGAGGAVLSRLGRTEWSQQCYSAVLLVSFKWPKPSEFIVTNVKRDRDWFAKYMPIMRDFWDKVIYHREHGIDDPPPKKTRKKKELIRPECTIETDSDDDYYDES